MTFSRRDIERNLVCHESCSLNELELRYLKSYQNQSHEDEMSSSSDDTYGYVDEPSIFYKFEKRSNQGKHYARAEVEGYDKVEEEHNIHTPAEFVDDFNYGMDLCSHNFVEDSSYEAEEWLNVLTYYCGEEKI